MNSSSFRRFFFGSFRFVSEIEFMFQIKIYAAAHTDNIRIEPEHELRGGYALIVMITFLLCIIDWYAHPCKLFVRINQTIESVFEILTMFVRTFIYQILKSDEEEEKNTHKNGKMC